MTGRSCSVCGGSAVEGSRCARHPLPVAEDNARRDAKRNRHGRMRAHFQRLRVQRLELAGGFCELHVDRACTRLATSVHLDPALEGDHDRATLADVRAACAHCHGVVDGRRAHG